MHRRSHHPNCWCGERTLGGAGKAAATGRFRRGGNSCGWSSLANGLGPDRVAILHARSLASPELLVASRAPSVGAGLASRRVAVSARVQWLRVIALANGLGPDRVANLHAPSIASPELLVP